MKLYKKKILNVNVGKCLLVSLITFVIRYFYANVYLGFHNSLVTITEGVRSQIYFGGILIDHSFDLISLSFFAILFILEICFFSQRNLPIHTKTADDITEMRQLDLKFNKSILLVVHS